MVQTATLATRGTTGTGWRGEALVVVQELGPESEVVQPLEDAGFSVRVRLSREPLDDLSPVLAIPILDLGDDRPLQAVLDLRLALGPLAPPVIVIADGADDAMFEHAFLQGAQDAIGRPAHPTLLRVKAVRHARRAVAYRGLGKFSVRKLLGRGGMGTVYLANDGAQDVALKVLELDPLNGDPENLVRFHREIAALKSVKARSIPRFVDAGRSGNTFYLAMEYVPGKTLHEVVRQGPIAPAAVARVIVEVGEALGTLHEAGLVHRDVKPANLIRTPGGDVKLVDFGLAKTMGDEGLTRSEEVLGTLPYMAPEILNGRQPDARSDAFALGMTALEALLGRCPMDGQALQVATRLSRGDVPRPDDLVDAPLLLKCVVGSLIHPDPDQRYRLADAVNVARELVDGAQELTCTSPA